jgi:hypothetical protein
MGFAVVHTAVYQLAFHLASRAISHITREPTVIKPVIYSLHNAQPSRLVSCPGNPSCMVSPVPLQPAIKNNYGVLFLRYILQQVKLEG